MLMVSFELKWSMEQENAVHFTLKSHETIKEDLKNEEIYSSL